MNINCYLENAWGEEKKESLVIEFDYCTIEGHNNSCREYISLKDLADALKPYLNKLEDFV
jgi:hypothetical protein